MKTTHLTTPPHSTEAEAALLGSVLYAPEAWEDANAEGLLATDFWAERHRVIWRHLVELRRQGQALDSLTLYQALETAGQLEVAGGAHYIANLTTTVPTAANARSYARIVAEKSTLRAVQRAALEAAAAAATASDAEEVVSTLVAAVTRAAASRTGAETVTLREALQGIWESLERVVDGGEPPGVRWGLGELHRVLGPLLPGELAVLAARPAMGKTALGVQVAARAASEGKGACLILSLEMGPQGIAARLMAEKMAAMRRGGRQITAGDLLARPEECLGHLQQVAGAFKALAPLDLHFSGVRDVGGISSLVRRFDRARRLETGHGLRLLVVDYLQLVQAPGSNSEAQIAEASKTLKALALDLDIPVLALAQLNRGPEGRGDKRPTLGDLRGSGQIEQDADQILFLYRDEYYNPESEDKGIAEVIAGKNRRGAAGSVRVGFKAETTSFYDLEAEELASNTPASWRA